MEVNKVYNKDCLEGLKELPDESIDLILTDPPYKVSQSYGGGVDASNLISVGSILRTFPEMCRVLKKSRFFVSFYDNRIMPFLFNAIEGTDFVYLKSIYLYRRWGNANRWMGWMQCTDPICFFVKGSDKPFYERDIKAKIKHDCYIKKSPESENTGHPAQKPLEIIRDIIIWCSKEGDTILDPYIGSGSVAVVCKELKRNFIGFENNKDYVDMANKRLQQIQLNDDGGTNFTKSSADDFPYQESLINVKISDSDESSTIKGKNPSDSFS